MGAVDSERLSPFILVQDSSRFATKQAIHSVVTKSSRVFHISLENRYDFSSLPGEYFKVDLFKKNSWLTEGTRNHLDAHCDVIYKNENKCTVFIDSLNQMVLLFGWTECFTFIQKLMSIPNIVKVVGVLHKDANLYGNKLTNYLKHLASTTIDLGRNAHSQIVMTTVVKKTKGKSSLPKKEVIFAGDYSNNNNISVGKSDKIGEAKESPLTSFKISLREEEKLVKDKLTLPYEEISKGKEANIHYENDSGDDWDDEDPDDDLMI